MVLLTVLYALPFNAHEFKKHFTERFNVTKRNTTRKDKLIKTAVKLEPAV